MEKQEKKKKLISDALDLFIILQVVGIILVFAEYGKIGSLDKVLVWISEFQFSKLFLTVFLKQLSLFFFVQTLIFFSMIAYIFVQIYDYYSYYNKKVGFKYLVTYS